MAPASQLVLEVYPAGIDAAGADGQELAFPARRSGPECCRPSTPACCPVDAAGVVLAGVNSLVFRRARRKTLMMAAEFRLEPAGLRSLGPP